MRPSIGKNTVESTLGNIEERPFRLNDVENSENIALLLFVVPHCRLASDFEIKKGIGIPRCSTEIFI